MTGLLKTGLDLSTDRSYDSISIKGESTWPT